MQLRPLMLALDTHVTFCFVDAPSASIGPQDPTIPDEVPTYEWYGVPGDFAHGWMREGEPADLDAATRALNVDGPYDGVIGFSQGAHVAGCVDARWAVLFSAVTPPNGRTPRRWDRPTFHAYDPAEEYAHMCKQVVDDAAPPTATTTRTHAAGHNVPHDSASVEAVVAFVRAQLSAPPVLN